MGETLVSNLISNRYIDGQTLDICHAFTCFKPETCKGGNVAIDKSFQVEVAPQTSWESVHTLETTFYRIKDLENFAYRNFLCVCNVM